MDLNSSALWGIIGVIGGIIVSSFFYFIGIRRKKISYNIYTFYLVENKVTQIGGLEIKYKSNSLDSLMSSSIFINNIGNSVIERNSFAPSCPITISTTGQFLIDDISKESIIPIEKEKQVHLVPHYNNSGQCNSINVDFDYLSPKDTLHYTLIHTGEISLKAALKDGKIINKTSVPKKSHYFFISYLTFIIVIMITIIITLLISSHFKIM